MNKKEQACISHQYQSLKNTRSKKQLNRSSNRSEKKRKLNNMKNMQIMQNMQNNSNKIRNSAEQPSMATQDEFENLLKYKMIIPLLYICCLVCTFAGPSFFPVLYQKVTLFFIAYFTLRGIYALMIIMYVLVQSCRISYRMKNNQYQSLTQLTQHIYYGFVLHVVSESIQEIQETLERLASHKRAKDYMIFLAMQQQTDKTHLTAQHVVEKYKNIFKIIDYSIYQQRPNEQKGKPANLSWCVEHLHLTFQKFLIDPNNVMLTMIGADVWIPDLYMDALEEMIYQEYDERNMRVYQPLRISARNSVQVPFTTRFYDNFQSYSHMVNLFSFFSLTVPLTNSTFSYALIKKIGFYDTNPQVFGDLHTFVKICWKTNMEVKGRPIYVPFNHSSLKTKKGYLTDIITRCYKAQRDGRSVFDVAYSLKMLFNNSFQLKSLLLCFLIFQTYANTATFPFFSLSIRYQNYILYKLVRPSPQLLSMSIMSKLSTMTMYLRLAAYLIFEIVKRRANTQLFNIENQSILRLVEFPILYLPLLYLMRLPLMMISSISILFID